MQRKVICIHSWGKKKKADTHKKQPTSKIIAYLYLNFFHSCCRHMSCFRNVISLFSSWVNTRQDQSPVFFSLTWGLASVQIIAARTFLIPAEYNRKPAVRWGTNECGKTEPIQSTLRCGGGQPAANSISARQHLSDQAVQSTAYRKPGQFDWVPVIDCFSFFFFFF